LTTKLNFRDNDFEVDFENNKNIYGGLTSDTESWRQDEIINYYLTHRDKLFSFELIDFLTSTGIDWTKENEIFHYPLDNEVVVEGWYDIIGTVLTDKKVVSFHWDNDSLTTNVHFGNDSRHGLRNEFKNFETFRLDFSIVIPKENLKRLTN
jgi:hypothetical protein